MSTLQLGAKETVFYSKIEGDPKKCCLVFLHEGLGCIERWNDFPERLCRKTGCPGLLYDRIGYGRSTPLQKPRSIRYVHDYALDELPKVLEAAIPGHDHILIGHSDGGSISLIYGAQRPAGLKGIVTEAAHVFVEPETIEGIRAADEAFERGKFKGLVRYHGEKTRQTFKAWSETWLQASFGFWNIETLLPSITCPLLVIQGADDQYGTAAQVKAIVSKSAGKAEAFFVEQCGHAPHLEQPDILLEKIAAFVGET